MYHLAVSKLLVEGFSTTFLSSTQRTVRIQTAEYAEILYDFIGFTQFANTCLISF